MNTVNASREIEVLLNFAERENMIENSDRICCRNALLDLLQVNDPYSGQVGTELPKSAVEILDKLLDYAAENGILQDNTTTYRDLMDARIMGCLMPRQSEVIRNFYNTVENQGIGKATDDFYRLSQASNYIRMDRIAKNLYWLSPTEYGDLEITINLSKPEKDPKEIAASKARPQANYPKCLLCLENVGYAGHINHPARQNHRVIPVVLADEQWYFQYSPYVYYNEHCILFQEKHVPMKISDKTFVRLFDFVNQFPHYFIGSNADLPIVGGSILTHEHFQGGRHVFPMEKAAVDISFAHPEYQGIKASIIRWPMSVIRLSGKNKDKLIQLSINILENWRKYSDETVNIHSFTVIEDEIVPHNTITPIVRTNKEEEFEIDLVLRNNKTTEEHPDGLFHPHKELHHIKKENIGLIEVMGLAVLPARLSLELKVIERILLKELAANSPEVTENTSMSSHLPWIELLIQKYGYIKDPAEASAIVEKEVGIKFLQVLMDAGVYKRDSIGIKGFKRFMETCGFITN